MLFPIHQLLKRFAPGPRAHAFGRLFGAGLLAAVVTTGLLFLMRHFVAIDEATLDERAPVGNLVFLRSVPEQEPPPHRPIRVDPPPPAEPPPQTREWRHTSTGSYGEGIYEQTPPSVGVGPREATESRLAIPLLRQAPDYPQRLRARGIEGWVVVSFTITETGATADAVVLDSNPPGAFDAAALRAIARYKYHPQLIAGRPVAMPGVALRIVFEMDEPA